MLASLVMCTASAVRAEDTPGAEALFQEGRKLAAQGRYEEACPKLAASQKLAPGLGTLLNLGDCYEKLGQTATAWATFHQAIALAQAAGRADREKVARERARALDGKLSRLTIKTTEKTPGLEVRRDGTALEQAVFGSAVPIDPGTHKVEATAPGRVAWSSSIEVPAGPANVELEIPALAKDEKSKGGAKADTPRTKAAKDGGEKDGSPERASGPDERHGSGQRTLGLVLGGAGIVGLGVGTGFGITALVLWNDAQSNHCSGSFCDERGLILVEDAKTNGTIATLSGAAGASLLLVGLIVHFSAPKGKSEPKTGFSIVPSVGAGPRGPTVGLEGSF